MRHMVLPAAAMLAILAGTAPGHAAELTVFVGGAVTEPLKEAGAQFAKRTGNDFHFVSDTTGGLQKRLAAGETADLIVVTAGAMDALEKDKRIAPGTRTDLARALIGVGVHAGAASPDLSSTESFKKALLAARSVAYVNPASGGTSGTYFEGLLKKMGIADAMKAKTVYRTQGSEVADAVAKGQAELGITFTSEMAPNSGVKVAGVLPADIQLPTIYTAAMVTGAAHGAEARAFLKSLTGADGREAMIHAGLEPLGR